jgi:ribonuclease Z
LEEKQLIFFFFLIAIDALMLKRRHLQRIWTQILGTGALDSPAALLVKTDAGSYLFNCGEGIQKLANEHHFRLARVNKVLLTSLSWGSMGGFFGACMSHQETKKSVIAPANFSDIFRAAAPFFGPDFSNPVKVIEVADESEQVVIDDRKRGGILIQSLWIQCGAASKERQQPRVDAFRRAANEFVRLEEEMGARRAGWKDARSGSGGAVKSRQGRRNSSGDFGDSADARVREHMKHNVKHDGVVRGVLGYLCETAWTRGKMDARRALAAGVCNGNMIGELADGFSVTLDDGRVVRPEDCLGPSPPTASFLIVDCPSVDYVASLRDSKLIGQHYRDAAADAAAARDDRVSVLDTIYHFGPREVVGSRDYVEWMRLFDDDRVQHVMMCSEQLPPRFVVRELWNELLHKLDSSLFPRLFSRCDWAAADADLVRLLPSVSNVVEPRLLHGRVYVPVGRRMHSLGPLPEALDVSGKALYSAISFDELWKSAAGTFGLPKRIARAVSQRGEHRVRWNDFRRQSNNGSDDDDVVVDDLDVFRPAYLDTMEHDVRVVMLGTSSAVPSALRNVTSIYVHLDEFDGGVLLDAGEGTLAQLLRRFGPDETRRRLGALRAIAITHMHADHHMGIVEVLRRRAQWFPRAEPLLVFGPLRLARYLARLALVSPDELNYRFETTIRWRLDNDNDDVDVDGDSAGVAAGVDDFDVGRVDDRSGWRHEPAESLMIGDSVRLTAVPCKHTHESRAFVLEHAAGDQWKVVFSGDTMPCWSIVEAARGATLLIHEATFENCAAQDAAERRHSTIRDALAARMRSGAYRLLLTHFSARYDSLNKHFSGADEQSAVAVDFLDISLKESLGRLPAVSHLYSGAFYTMSAMLGNHGRLDDQDA